MSLSLAVGLLLSLLPLCGFAVAVAVFRLYGEGWRSSIIAAATCNAVYVAFSTELLSVFHLITLSGIAAAWVMLDIASLVYARYLFKKKRKGISVERSACNTRNALDRFDTYLFAGVSLVAGLVGLTAILAPPNTLDVLAYHLPRVAMWAINKDVWNYPTFESQQLFLSPWAEYASLHLYVLSGTDYLSNLVEWSCMIGLVIAVSLVAERLGAGTRGQMFSAVACATMPGLVLEASGSMNTCAGAFWIVVCVYFFLRANDDRNWKLGAGAASAAGLAIFTKGTSHLFLPFLLLACWAVGCAQARKFWFRKVPLIVFIVLLLNGPLAIRNYNLSGSPLGFAMASGADEQRQYANSKHAIGATYANAVRNAVLQIGTPIQAVNRKIEASAKRAISIFALDPDDPVSTARGGFVLPALSAHESTAGSAAQFILIVTALFLLVSKRYGDRKLRVIGLGVCLSFILFCVMIRWTQWNARYVLPLMCVGISVASVVVERALPKIASFSLAMVLLVFAMPFALQNTIRPLAPWKVTSLFHRPRLDFYLEEWQQTLEPSYKFAAEQVMRSSCRDIGIDSGLDDVEYPLLAMLRHVSNRIDFRFYRTKNASSRYERIHHPPCSVICLRCARLPAKWVEYQSIGGKASTFDEIAVFSSNGSQDNRLTVVMPQPFDPLAMAKQLDAARDAVGYSIFAPEAHSGLSAAIPKVAQAGRDWPGKALDLQARLHGVESLSLKAWRARDSVDPMLRSGEKLNYADVDPLQFVAVSELLEIWKSEAAEKIQAVDDLVDQLYTAWEMRLTGAFSIQAETSDACYVHVEKLADVPAERPLLPSNRLIRLEDCGCLGNNPSAGTVVVRKPLGVYDSDATVAAGCKLRSIQ